MAAPPAGAPQPTSLLMQSAAVRVAMAAGLVALLWAAVAWSMAGAA